jgi:hypothetical protein|tara:strand:- start:327 stop:548 length:222 start_codon:yes stop_codon:yes gene_type:complete
MLIFDQIKSNQMPILTNNPTFDKFLDDEYQCQGYVQAFDLIQKIRSKTQKKLNDKEWMEFRKTIANALDLTLK